MAPRRGSATWLPLPILALVTLWVFWPAGAFDFVAYDDPRYVTANPRVAAGLTRAGLAWAFTSVGYAGNWHPLTWLSHMADVQAFGLRPGGHHAVSVLLHLAGACALFLVLRGMTGARWRSLLVAGLFAVHPLHVESVAWVAERKDVLSGLLWMLALGAYLRYAHRRSAARYAVALLVFLLALLAKPMAMTLPAILLLLDWWPLGRVARSPAPTGAGGGGGLSLRALLVEKVPFLALSAGSLAVTYVAQVRGRGFSVDRDAPFVFGLPNALVSYVVYLAASAWPAGLSCFYPLPAAGTPAWQAAAAGSLLAALTVAALRRAPRSPWLAAGWLWYLATLVPVIGVLQVGDQARADRYTYLPLIGVFLAVVWGGRALAGRRGGAVAALVGAGALCALLPVARAQVRVWSDSLTLFSHAREVVADNWLAEYNLGTIRARERRYDAAAAHLSAALAIRPDRLDIRHNLGVSLVGLGRTDEAIGHFAEVVRRAPGFADSRYHLGLALEARGRLREAVEQFSALVSLRPDDAEARYRLAKDLRLLQQ